MKFRTVATLACIAGFGLAVIVLSLSDRAPAQVPGVLDWLVALGRRFESVSRIDVFDLREIPGETDQIGHAVLWGSGMLSIGFMTRHRIPVLATACFLLAASILVEFLQVTWTATRALQVSDALANGVGIAMATAAVLALGAVVDLAVRLRQMILGSAASSTLVG